MKFTFYPFISCFLIFLSLLANAQHGPNNSAATDPRTNDQVLAVTDYAGSSDIGGSISKSKFEAILAANEKYDDYKTKIDQQNIDYFEKEKLLKKFIKENKFEDMSIDRLSLHSLRKRIEINKRLRVKVRQPTSTTITITVSDRGQLLGVGSGNLVRGDDIELDLIEEAKQGLLFRSKNSLTSVTLNRNGEIVLLELSSEPDFKTYSVKARARTKEEIESDIKNDNS